MIIDAHTHIGKLPGTKYVESYEKNLQFLLDEGKESRVDHFVILAGLEKKDGFNITTENLIKLVGDEKRVSVVAGINIDYEKSDLVNLEIWAKARKIVGFKFYTGYQHYYPSDERCKPIYEMALKHDLPVIFHSGDTLAGYVGNPKVKYSHPLHVDDIATDIPELKIIIAHVGNPWITDCAEVVYKNQNVYADISGLAVGDDFDGNYGDLIKRKIKELVDYVEPKQKLLYGTDWPIIPMKTYIKFANSLDLTDETRDSLFHENAARLFRLEI